MKKVLMIILDGFSSRYLKRELCPHLYDIKANHYFSRIEPMFAFQGIGAAIYTGAMPNTTGIFTEFIHKENEIFTKSKFLKILFKFTDVLPADDLCINVRNFLYKMFRKKGYGISNVIPSSLLDYFSPKLKVEYTEKKALGNIPTIFDILRESNLSYELQRPAVRLEISTYKTIINRIQSGKNLDFTVLHPCSLDIMGHKFGPHSFQIIRLLKMVDEQIYRIVYNIKSSSEKIVLIILSDHGMSPVKKYINLFYILKSLPLKIGEDYLFFLDSTMIRFWFFKDKAKKLVYERFSTLDFGQILDKPAMEKLKIDKIGKEYAELIFVLNEGYVIFPDFFWKHTPPRGMHGYAFPKYDTPILLIYAPNLSISLEKRAVIRFIDIMPTILDLFDLPTPPSCEGDSLLK